MYIEANICMRYTQRSKGLPSSLVPSPPTPNQKESGREPSIISQSSGIHIALENGGRPPASHLHNQNDCHQDTKRGNGPPHPNRSPWALAGGPVGGRGVHAHTRGCGGGLRD